MITSLPDLMPSPRYAFDTLYRYLPLIILVVGVSIEQVGFYWEVWRIYDALRSPSIVYARL